MISYLRLIPKELAKMRYSCCFGGSAGFIMHYAYVKLDLRIAYSRKAPLKVYATVAQLVEQLIRNQQVVCSSHISSSKAKRL